MMRLAVGALIGGLLCMAWLTGCAKEKSLRIAVIPKGTTHAFWKSVEAGARTAENELGVQIIWKGPLKENDRAEQIRIVEQFVTDGVSGIVLAPLDDAALLRPVQAATEKKIPVVIIDSALKGEVGKDFISFVATNNRKGGQMAGEEMIRLLGGKGKVVVLRYQVGSASTDEREAGFFEAIAKAKDIQVISENRYAGPTVGEAKTASMNMVDKLKMADGIFCPNESSTMGMLLALRQIKRAGKVKFVGFDTSGPLIEALRAGELDGLIAQDPRRMGYEGVTILVKQINGQKAPAAIDTGARLITRENIDDPEVKKILQTP